MQLSSKRLFFSLLFLTFNALTEAHADSLPLTHDLTIEAREAKQKEIPILVLFMSDSCHFCEIVLDDFLLPMYRDPAYKNKVILRQIETSSTEQLIDFDGTKTSYRDFSRKNKVWGVPNVIFFDSNGKVLTSIVGLLTVDFYYAYLDMAINESIDKIKQQNK